MADFEDGLFEQVTGDAAVSAVIGTNLYRGRAPQETTTPYAVYTTVFNDTGMSMASVSGLADRLVQISLFGPAIDTLEDLAESVRLSLANLRGEKLGTTNVRVWVSAFKLEPELYEDDTKLFHLPLQIAISHTENKV